MVGEGEEVSRRTLEGEGEKERIKERKAVRMEGWFWCYIRQGQPSHCYGIRHHFVH